MVAVYQAINIIFGTMMLALLTGVKTIDDYN